MQDDDLQKPARRSLLSGLFLGAAAATTAGLSSRAVEAAPVEAGEASDGFRETEHVRRYYESADD